MAEEETNSRIADLKARLEADPGSRVFYQLGEELRKSDRAEEAEDVLRQGLEKHPAYLSAWISLGRALKEMSRSEEAIDVLNRAFQLDRQNVVVARLLGESYSEIGEHVEAIKKYKLVAALHPADEEVQEKIQELEKILGDEGSLEQRTAPPPKPAAPVEDRPAEQPSDEAPVETEAFRVEVPERQPEGTDLFGAPEEPEEDSSFPEPVEPTWASHDVPEEEEPAGEFAEPVPEPVDTSEGEPEDTYLPEAAAEADDDVVATVTMGDLYARQGHVDQARSIYRRVLDREPDHRDAQERLDAIAQEDQGEPTVEEPESSPEKRKIRRLEEWLAKVGG